MPALRHSSDREPGYTRRRHGRGERYLDERGRQVRDPRVVHRLKALAIPPAWHDVWICRSSRGHLQATGIDAAGRKQYLYHPAWREERDREKYARILRFADRLPALRATAERHLRRRRLDRDKALATAVQLLDRTFIRVGGEEYAASSRTFGLVTFRSRHLTVEDDLIVLDFEGKGGADQHAEVESARLARVLQEMDDLPGYEVLKYRDGDGTVVDVRSEDVNAYIQEHAGEEFSAKDFRTWAGTVAAAVALDEVGPVDGARSRQRAVLGRVQAGGVAARQHAGRLPGQLHRPARDRPLPGRPHDLLAAGRGRAAARAGPEPGGGRGAGTPAAGPRGAGRRLIEKAAEEVGRTSAGCKPARSGVRVNADASWHRRGPRPSGALGFHSAGRTTFVLQRPSQTPARSRRRADRAARYPHIPWTPPPGGVDEEQR